MNRIKQSLKKYSSAILVAIIMGSCVYATTAAAADGGGGIGGLATNVTKSFQDIGKLMIGVAYLAGIGFAIAAIFKFKQHKDNPTQIPVGTPIALMIISVALVFLPNFFKPAGETIFGAGDKAGGFTGSGVSALPGNQ
jgi:intracellular multiplication protein IcmD